jgi:hypothetical protein
MKEAVVSLYPGRHGFLFFTTLTSGASLERAPPDVMKSRAHYSSLCSRNVTTLLHARDALDTMTHFAALQRGGHLK